MSWRTIRKELDSVEVVNDVLLVLDVVIGFLSSAGGDPEQKLSSYLQDVLKYSPTHGADHLPGKRVCIISLYLSIIVHFIIIVVLFTGRRSLSETHTQLLDPPIYRESS